MGITIIFRSIEDDALQMVTGITQLGYLSDFGGMVAGDGSDVAVLFPHITKEESDAIILAAFRNDKTSINLSNQLGKFADYDFDSSYVDDDDWDDDGEEPVAGEHCEECDSKDHCDDYRLYRESLTT